MPRFFFSVHDGVSIPDEVGTELSDLHQARLEAIRYSGELLKEHPDAFWVQNEWRIEVRDVSGLILFAIHISAVQAPALHDWKPSRIDDSRPKKPPHL